MIYHLQWPTDEHRSLVTRKNRIGVLTVLLAVRIGTGVAEEFTFPTTENTIFKILSLAQGFPASPPDRFPTYPLTSSLVQVE